MTALPRLAELHRAALRAALAKALERLSRGGPPPFALDATAGKGRDTLFLAQAVGPQGAVLALDVQEAALSAARARLESAGLADRVRLVLSGHQDLAVLLPEAAEGVLDAAVFNLGFLPGSDRRVVTTPETTLTALRMLETRLRPGAVISIHCYTGHPGGADETAAVTRWAEELPWKSRRVLRLECANKEWNKETLLLIETVG